MVKIRVMFTILIMILVTLFFLKIIQIMYIYIYNSTSLIMVSYPSVAVSYFTTANLGHHFSIAPQEKNNCSEQ